MIAILLFYRQSVYLAIAVGLALLYPANARGK